MSTSDWILEMCNLLILENEITPYRRLPVQSQAEERM